MKARDCLCAAHLVSGCISGDEDVVYTKQSFGASEGLDGRL